MASTSASANCLLTQADEAIVAMTTAYGCVLAQLVNGEKLDALLSDKLMDLVDAGDLPFHAVTSENLGPPKPGDPDPPRAGRFSSPDALLTPSYMAEAALDPGGLWPPPARRPWRGCRGSRRARSVRARRRPS